MTYWTGQTQFGFIDNLFQVPLSELLSGYTFNAANDPGVVDPSGPVYQEFGFPLDGGSNPFEGGTTGVDGPYEYPWDGLTYTLNPLQPFTNFYDSLLATPSTSGIDGTGIEIPTLTEFTHALQNVAAGLVIDFDPFVLGSPLCAASCDIPQVRLSRRWFRTSQIWIRAIRRFRHGWPSSPPARLPADGKPNR